MSGKAETKNVPPGSSRACRGVLTQDFDDLQGDMKTMYTAVIFNPVPGPPMGKNPRLSFRYWLKGTDTLRVQIYSLTNGYHRYLIADGLAAGEVAGRRGGHDASRGGPTAAAARCRRTSASTTSSSTSIRGPNCSSTTSCCTMRPPSGGETAVPEEDPVHRLVRHRQAGQGVAGHLRDRREETAALEGGKSVANAEGGRALDSPDICAANGRWARRRSCSSATS